MEVNCTAKDTFVTVVSVDADKVLVDGQNTETKKLKMLNQEMYASDCLKEEKTMPKPIPRQFVTVVSVGSTEKLKPKHEDKNVESNLRLRLEVSGVIEENSESKSESKNSLPTALPHERDSQVPDQVVVFRLPGERLGLGLKFEGGMGATEKVRRLFIQSVAPDSPAARASVPWGDLNVGDQILYIEGCHVSKMTRVECVSRLKEASVKLTIGVLKGNGEIPETEIARSPQSNQIRLSSSSGAEKSKRIPAPPLPPRLRPRKSPARPPKEVAHWPPPPEGFEDLDNDEPVGKVARVSANSSFTEDYEDDAIFNTQLNRYGTKLPPTAVVYLDLFSEEENISRGRNESESDDTNSSASTVVDRLSISSSGTVSRNSSFNAAADAAKFDLAKALGPFEHLEKEISTGTDRRQRSLSTPQLLSVENHVSSDLKEGSENMKLNVENNTQSDFSSPPTIASNGKPKSLLKSLSFSQKLQSSLWHTNKLSAEAETDTSEKDSLPKKLNKLQAPLPPPRSITSKLSTVENIELSNNILDAHHDIDSNELNHVICNVSDDSEQCEVFENEFPSIVEKKFEETQAELPQSGSANISTESSSSFVELFMEHSQSGTDCNKSSESDGNNYYKSIHTVEKIKIVCPSALRRDCIEVGNAETDKNTNVSGIKKPVSVTKDIENEPLNSESYPDDTEREFFIDHVSNPSYGLTCSKDAEPVKETPVEDDELYEEVSASQLKDQAKICNTSSFCDHSYVIEEGKTAKQQPDKKIDLCSLSSSLSSISLASNELEEMKAVEVMDGGGSLSDLNMFRVEDENASDERNSCRETQPNTFTISSSEKSLLRQDDQYDYVDVLSSNKTNSVMAPVCFTQTDSNIRERKDLSEILHKKLGLPKEDNINVVEEDVIESVVECETEDEVLMVLRALRSDNVLSLDEQFENEYSEADDSFEKTSNSAESFQNESEPTSLPLGMHMETISEILMQDGNENCFSRIPATKNEIIGSIGRASKLNEIAKERETNTTRDHVIERESKYSKPPLHGSSVKIETDTFSSDNTYQNPILYSEIRFPISESWREVIEELPEDQEAPKVLNLDSGSCSDDIVNRPICKGNTEDIPSCNKRIEAEENIVDVSSKKSQFDKQDGENVTLYEERITSSSSEASTPLSYPRFSPNGNEFPSNYTEGLQEKIDRISQYTVKQEGEGDPTWKNSLTSSNPYSFPVPPLKLSAISPLSECRSVSRWRRQDERSERSVRDKIAMFSTEKERSKTKSQKIDRSESISGGHKEKTHMKRSLTEDDVRIQSNRRENKVRPDATNSKHHKKQDKPSVYSSMINVHSSDSDSKENVKPASSETDIRGKGFNLSSKPNSLNKSKQPSEVKSETHSGLHSRSQSLNDIGKSGRMKRHSVGAYDRPSVYKYGVEKPEEKERRTSLNNLIEQRRKSISKLRGLVIPEAKAKDNISEARFPLDLPKISSHTSHNFKTMSLPREGTKNSSLYKTDSVSSIDSCSSSTSKQSNAANSYCGKGVTRLSPAHSRKYSLGSSNKSDSLPPLSSRPARNQSPLRDFTGSTSPLMSTQFPQKGFDRTLSSHSEQPFEMSKYNDRSLHSRNSGKNFQDSRLNRSEDSDNDSAVSSTQSSFSQSLSPRASPMLDSYDPDDRYSPTRSVRSRHSPQSSIDEFDPKRILKSDNSEAENRRNVLRSAKCSSGRNSDEFSTPEISRKLSSDFTPEMNLFTDLLDTELRQGQKKSFLKREESIDSFSSTSSHHSSFDSSRRNSKDSVIQASSNNDNRVSVQAVYIDKEGDLYKESQLKVAYLNEIIDDYEELSSDKETIVAEIPLQNNKSWSNETATTTTPIVEKHELNKWSVLEHKYLYAKQDNESIESKQLKYLLNENGRPNRPQCEVKENKTNKADFRALADKWKQRTEEDQLPRNPQFTVTSDSVINDANDQNQREFPNKAHQLTGFSRTENVPMETSIKSSLESSRFFEIREDRPNTLNLPRIDLPDRKFSVPEYGSNLKLREKRETSSGDVPSRPTSLIESSGAMETLHPDGQYMLAPLSPLSASADSREDLLDSSEASLSRTGSKELLEAFSKSHLTIGTIPKMSEIMRAFERHEMSAKTFGGSHPRMSSLDSTASDDGLQAHYGSVSSLASGQRDQYGSITSLSSSTSIISPQELAQLIEEANHSLEESGTPSHEILVVVLHREIVGQGSIGITLAGGADYETKEITVHKVIPGSLADRDGRIQKGDRVLSINGKTLRGVSHREALNILKSPRPEVVLVLSRSRSVTPQESTATQSNGDTETGFSHRSVFINHVPPPRPPKILESPMDSKSLVSDLPVETVLRGPPMNVVLVKDGAGLGFSLEGGKDSPLGDRPLTVKKVFSGGAADKEGILKVGDELLGVNSVDLTNMARIEAWNFLKKLPDGKVSLVIKQKVTEADNDGDQSLKSSN